MNFKLRCFIKKEVATGNVLDDKDIDDQNISKPKKNSAGAAWSSNLQQVMIQGENHKDAQNRKKNWLCALWWRRVLVPLTSTPWFEEYSTSIQRRSR